ncbi:MAG: sporulation initiation factor Spo0A C-terminal domain-containing protein [Clostridia bacterium]
MSKILFQTVLLTKGDSIARKLHFFCRTKGIGFFDTESLAELFVNAKCLQPRVIFFDLDTILVSEFICKEFMSFSRTKSLTICLISSNEQLLSEFSDVYLKATPSTVEEIFSANMSTFLQQDFFDIVRSNVQNKEKGDQICEILLKLGLTEKHLGFAYIKECVLLILANKSNLKSLSKTVFPTIAAKYQTSTANIERSIRTAISKFDAKKACCFFSINLNQDENFSAKKFVSFVVNLIDN